MFHLLTMVLAAATLLSAVQHSWAGYCPDRVIWCPDDQTCCVMNTMGTLWGCCPIKNAVCCTEGCCPPTYKCGANGKCIK
ncbi:progranulin-like [Ruditapes philippinarum]|uniref:progranulin-like n=1 Tax=Ruditapes philippinarum TaxID=129788 RepID=UPI00295AECF6|nr:progranulin-like [Ruditapes philippinarum]